MYLNVHVLKRWRLFLVKRVLFKDKFKYKDLNNEDCLANMFNKFI